METDLPPVARSRRHRHDGHILPGMGPPSGRRHFLGAVLGGIGGVLGGVGSIFGANKKNQAGADALNLYDTRTNQALQRAGMLLYGPQFMDIMRAGLPGEALVNDDALASLGLLGRPDPGQYGKGEQDEQYQQRVREYDAQQAAIKAATDAVGGPLYGQYQNLSQFGQDAGGRALYGKQGGGGGGLFGRSATAVKGARRDLDKTQEGFQNLLAQLGGYFGQARAGVGQAYGRAEGEARNWARGQENVLRTDAAEGLKNQNQLAQASLAGLGANTLTGNQLQANAQQNQRELSRALTDLGAARTDRVMGAQMRGADAMTGLYGQQGGLMGAIGQQQQATGANQRGALRSMQMGRAGALYGAEQDQINRQLQLMGMPLGLPMQFQNSSIANPFLGMNTSQFFPGASGTGNALGQLGGAVGGIGMADLFSQAGGFGSIFGG